MTLHLKKKLLCRIQIAYKIKDMRGNKNGKVFTYSANNRIFIVGILSIPLKCSCSSGIYLVQRKPQNT